LRDEVLLAVNKPSGLAVHRGWAREKQTALALARNLAGRHVYPTHRLDRGTSGVLLFALDRPMAAAIGEQFAGGGVEKHYLALVRGIAPDSGVIDHAIAQRPGAARVPATTSFRRLASFERYSLVEATPHTGRLHQVRRHLKHISHPLIGDVRYGKGEHNRLFRDRFGLHRLALHAARLSFTHPNEGQRVIVRAPLPRDLAGPLEAMGLLTAAESAETESTLAALERAE
jgi:tRNA pseudouridine65 synthase